MPIATEAAIIHLKPDATIEDASSEAGKSYKGVMEMLAAQKGFVGMYTGRQIENPNILIMSIDWEDVSDHHNFMKSPDYKGFFQLASPIFDLSKKPYLLHTQFASPPPNGPRDAAVTEFVYFTLKKDASEEQKSALEDACLKIGLLCTTDGGASASSTGWVLEEVDHEQGVDGKAIALNMILGWPSKEAHMSFRENKLFAEAAGPVRGMVLPPKGPGKGMYHVKLTKY